VSEKPLTPERRKYLELCVKLIKMRESAIRYGARHLQFKGDPRYTDPFTRARQISLCQKINSRRFEPYAESLMRLKIARSKMAAELEGLKW
jgi:hypothetical protein